MENKLVEGLTGVLLDGHNSHRGDKPNRCLPVDGCGAQEEKGDGSAPPPPILFGNESVSKKAQF